MAQAKRLTVRVQHIPLSYSEDDVKAALVKELTVTEREVTKIFVSLIPSCGSEEESQDALVQFHPGPPEFLKILQSSKKELLERQIETNGAVLNLDVHFCGLTQVSNAPLAGSTTVECVHHIRSATSLSLIRNSLVFITGLDGNAFGSWCSRSTAMMWPREFLRDDMPNARVLTFGYNSKLLSNASHVLDDYCTQFISSLLLARKSKDVCD